VAGRNSIFSQWQAVIPLSANAGNISIFSQWQAVFTLSANGRP
jgi:hypothetical protein